MTGFQVIDHDREHPPIIDGETRKQSRVETHEGAQKNGDDKNEVSPLSATDWFHRQISSEKCYAIVLA